MAFKDQVEWMTASNQTLSDKAWAKVKPTLTRGRGRPAGSGMKQQVTLRIDTETLDFYKAKGEGWQTFINTVLGQIRREVKTISLVEKRIIKGTLIGGSAQREKSAKAIPG
jgi:uncharacterized protein (DUF4415 family)